MVYFVQSHISQIQLRFTPAVHLQRWATEVATDTPRLLLIDSGPVSEILHSDVHTYDVPKLHVLHRIAHGSFYVLFLFSGQCVISGFHWQRVCVSLKVRFVLVAKVKYAAIHLCLRVATDILLVALKTDIWTCETIVEFTYGIQ